MSIKDQIIEALGDAEFETCNITEEVMSFLENLKVEEPKPKVVIVVADGAIESVSSNQPIEYCKIDFDGFKNGDSVFQIVQLYDDAQRMNSNLYSDEITGNGKLDKEQKQIKAYLQIWENEQQFITWATINHGSCTQPGCEIKKALQKYQADPNERYALVDVVDTVIETDDGWLESWQTFINEVFNTVQR